jgi:hypothetical protein
VGRVALIHHHPLERPPFEPTAPVARLVGRSYFLRRSAGACRGERGTPRCARRPADTFGARQAGFGTAAARAKAGESGPIRLRGSARGETITGGWEFIAASSPDYVANGCTANACWINAHLDRQSGNSRRTAYSICSQPGWHGYRQVRPCRRSRWNAVSPQALNPGRPGPAITDE